MDLKDLKNAIIDDEGGYKYILIRVVDINVNEKNIVRADKKKKYHRLIMEDAKRDIPFNLHCIGGGYIDVNLENKKISIWGRSIDYGEDKKDVTKKILEEEYKDFCIVIGR
jgi:hypothetical protein